MQNAPFGPFCNTFDLHQAIIGLLSGHLRQVLLYKFDFWKKNAANSV